MKILCQCKNGYEAKFLNEVVTNGVINLPEKEKDYVNGLIKQNVVDSDIHIEFYIEDNGWKGNIISIPCKLHEVVDVIFSHNNIVSLWLEDENDSHYSNRLWRGMAHSIPEEFKNYLFKGITGIVAETLHDSDVINIEVLKPEENKDA